MLPDFVLFPYPVLSKLSKSARACKRAKTRFAIQRPEGKWAPTFSNTPMHFHWKIGIFQTLLLELAGERGEGLAALRVPFPFPLAAGALANYLKLTALRPLVFFRTSPYRSKLLTALYEKSPALRAELQIVCGEGGIRTPGAFQLNSFQDCRNRPLYHLSKVCRPVFGTGLQI